MFQLVYCVGGSLKNLCHFEMGVLANADVIRGSLNAYRGEGGKICQNLADVICERSLTGCWTSRGRLKATLRHWPL